MAPRGRQGPAKAQFEAAAVGQSDGIHDRDEPRFSRLVGLYETKLGMIREPRMGRDGQCQGTLCPLRCAFHDGFVAEAGEARRAWPASRTASQKRTRAKTG